LWYLKFDQVTLSYSLKENVIYKCIYHKGKKSKFGILVPYIDAILLARNVTGSFSVSFYQANWNIINKEVCEDVLHFLNSGELDSYMI
jgi:hypothetical protein